MKYTGIKIILFIVIIVLAWLVVDSIRTPLRFNRVKEQREKVVIENLKDIRSGQLIFKTIHKSYAKNFDTLIDFIRNGEIPEVNIIPDPEDTTFTKTIKDTLGYVNVADSLYGHRPDFSIDSLRYIPFSGGKEFSLDAGTIETGGITVNVFEASALYTEFLRGLDEQLILNLVKAKEDIDRFPGLKVGSMNEASTDGNWE